MFKSVFEAHILCLRLSQEDIDEIKSQINSQIINKFNVKPIETNSYSAILENTVITHNNQYLDTLTLSDLHKPVNAKSSNICCFWDTKQFDSPPVCLPISHDKNNTFITIGCFCSTACAAAYNLADTRYRYAIRLDRHNLLLKMHNLSSTQELKLAPPRERLKCFGGDLTISDFRNCSSYDKRVLLPPYRPYTIFSTDDTIPKYNIDNIDSKNNDIKWKLLLSKKNDDNDARKNKGLSKFIDVN